MTGILLGIGFGAFMALAVYGLHPPRPSLAQRVAALRQPLPTPQPSMAKAGGRGGWAARAGRGAVPALTAIGLPGSSLGRDLRLAEVEAEHFLAEKAAAGLVGIIAPGAAMAALWALTGTGPGWQASAAGSLAVGAVLFFTPDLSVRATARRRRDELRHTLSVFLNLTVVALAGGAGVHQALGDAGASVHGWAAAQLRRALTAAEVSRTNVWHEIGELGRHSDVRELTELAATVSLAGSEGAKIRASLEAKASAMRTRRLTENDGAAQAATERMSLPVVVLFTAFLIFIGFPAMHKVLAGF
ncbi:type II secretion system F family protein [Streptomyces sp. NPDC102381]|uniref:type II secretion system F family protein n=1 Tax=Streptomyces sp. NPDC102381 TaxID=3366164 RepID=UPI003812A8A6